MTRRDYIAGGGDPDPHEAPLGGPDYIPFTDKPESEPPAVKPAVVKPAAKRKPLSSKTV